jgi:hypothetical protein
VTQVTKLGVFSESPREKVSNSHGVCEKTPSFVTCVTPPTGDDENEVRI